MLGVPALRLGLPRGKLTLADVVSYLERVKEMVEGAKKLVESS